jgi:hypothetical protein
VHLAIDDHSRLAYSEILPDETRGSCLRFLFNALRFFRSCPSSADLGHFVSVRKGGSGSSCFDVMRPAGDAASGGLRWFGV